MTAPHTRTGYTTVDPSEGEQAKPCYPDPVMDAVRRCAEIAESFSNADHIAFDIREGIFPNQSDVQTAIVDRILAEFGLLPTSET